MQLNGREISIFGDWLKIALAKNYYIAFSLPFSGPILTIFIVAIILGLLYYWLILNKSQNFRFILPLTIILFGAISNILDRIKFGFVIDYIDLKYFTVFNLADAMITGGVVILFLMFFLNKEKKHV